MSLSTFDELLAIVSLRITLQDTNMRYAIPAVQRLAVTLRMIECAFGILSNKWRVSTKDIDLQPNNTISVVKACCMLHNITIRATAIVRATNRLHRRFFNARQNRTTRVPHAQFYLTPTLNVGNPAVLRKADKRLPTCLLCNKVLSNDFYESIKAERSSKKVSS
ncbi:hypothetical protein EVAR_57737_1 [Eumeta japonica]|uniref:DDE Tnp4 domain-containing protein n=1 Tax=Eumeta variegata TaxID=151549 RepID=A0A4C1Y7P0_EUMVA|nr:hypothetical protein EVAR_57737_1 [Eumeta japonica]